MNTPPASAHSLPPPATIAVRVELYGLARAWAGANDATLDVPAPATLGRLLAALAGRFPALAPRCIAGEQLAPGFLASLAGERFVLDPATALSAGAVVLILSSDAGG